MLLLYKGYQIADRGAALFAPSRQLLLNGAGVGYGYRCQWDAQELALACDPLTAPTKVAQITAALANQEGDLQFLYPNGATTNVERPSTQTLSGVRCISGPNWLPVRGATFQTFLAYSASFAWEEVHPAVFLQNPERWLLDFHETVSVTGGTPRLVRHDPINAPSVVQTTIPLQGWSAVQEGEAVGYSRYPVPVPPFWPGNLTAKSVTRSSPRRAGRNYTDFAVQWRYEYLFGGLAEPTALPAYWVADPALPLPPTVP